MSVNYFKMKLKFIDLNQLDNLILRELIIWFHMQVYILYCS